MFYTGIDQHKRDSFLATYDPDGRLVKQGRVRNTRAAQGLHPFDRALLNGVRRVR
jgi:hypothetical protein